MCGIVGYVGPSVDGKALDVVMEGLARLEYRGYDSAGVALVTADGVVSEKRAGKLCASCATPCSDALITCQWLWYPSDSRVDITFAR